MHLLRPLLLLAAVQALPAAAQRMPPDPLVGVARPAFQNFSQPEASSLRGTARQGYYLERARRAERQARFNRHFPGTPTRVIASRP